MGSRDIIIAASQDRALALLSTAAILVAAIMLVGGLIGAMA